MVQSSFTLAQNKHLWVSFWTLDVKIDDRYIQLVYDVLHVLAVSFLKHPFESTLLVWTEHVLNILTTSHATYKQPFISTTWFINPINLSLAQACSTSEENWKKASFKSIVCC